MLIKILTYPWRRLRWLFTARPIRFTRFGWFYILFSLAVGAAAINTGNNLLYLMLGLLLGFIILSGFLSDSCLWGLDVTFEPRGDFYAGQIAEWDLVAKKSWFPAIAARVEAFWESHPPTHHLFYWVPRYGSRRLRMTLTPKTRGLFRLTSERHSTCFPFGLFEKSHRWPTDQGWVVFPRVHLLSQSLLQAAGANFSDEPAERKGQGAIPFDIRPYQSGDSSKRIHWKSTARRGRLMVTEMEEESAASQRVAVTHWPAGPDLEKFISFVASLIYTLYRQGQPVGLQTPGAVFEAEHSRAQLKRILTYLALVNPEKEQAVPSIDNRRRSIDALAAWKKIGRTFSSYE